MGVRIFFKDPRKKWCPRRELNTRTRIRNPTLYPLSYGGFRLASPVGVLRVSYLVVRFSSIGQRNTTNHSDR